MSSFSGYKGYSQIDSRSEYLLPITDTSGILQLSIASTVKNSSNIIRYDGSVLNTKNASAIWNELLLAGGVNIQQPLQLKDMGKVLYILENGVEVLKLRMMQPVDGALTEGVPGNYPSANVYVCVWSANPAITVIHVARIG